MNARRKVTFAGLLVAALLVTLVASSARAESTITVASAEPAYHIPALAVDDRGDLHILFQSHSRAWTATLNRTSNEWVHVQTLGDETVSDSEPLLHIAATGPVIAAAWGTCCTSAYTGEFPVAVSYDYGATFTMYHAPVQVGANRGSVAVDDAGTVHAVWSDASFAAEGAIDYAHLSRGSADFTPAVILVGNHGDSPRIAVLGNRVAVVWPTGVDSLQMTYSSDGGLTFAPPTNLSIGVGTPDILALNGQFVLTWLGWEVDGYPTRLATSPDGGATYGPFSDLQGNLSQCDPVSPFTAGHDGFVYGAWVCWQSASRTDLTVHLKRGSPGDTAWTDVAAFPSSVAPGGGTMGGLAVDADGHHFFGYDETSSPNPGATYSLQLASDLSLPTFPALPATSPGGSGFGAWWVWAGIGGAGVVVLVLVVLRRARRSREGTASRVAKRAPPAGRLPRCTTCGLDLKPDLLVCPRCGTSVGGGQPPTLEPRRSPTGDPRRRRARIAVGIVCVGVATVLILLAVLWPPAALRPAAHSLTSVSSAVHSSSFAVDHRGRVHIGFLVDGGLETAVVNGTSGGLDSVRLLVDPIPGPYGPVYGSLKLAASNGFVFVAWLDWGTPLVAVSTDDGDTFSTPVRGTPGNFSSLQAVADKPGNLYLVGYGQDGLDTGHVTFATLASGAAALSPSVVLASVNATRLAVAPLDGGLSVAWLDRAGSVGFVQSRDGGASFSSVRTLQVVEAEFLGGLSMASRGNVVSILTEGFESVGPFAGSYRARLFTSTDGGATFASPAVIGQDIGCCSDAALAYGLDGNLYAAIGTWNGPGVGGFELAVLRSASNGVSWTELPFSTAGVPAASPQSIAIAADGSGHVYVAYDSSIAGEYFYTYEPYLVTDAVLERPSTVFGQGILMAGGVLLAGIGLWLLRRRPPPAHASERAAEP